MISVTLNEIFNATETFKVIMNQQFKGSLAFKIARLVRELDKEMETFNTERQKILTEYCVKDTDGNIQQDENGNIQIQPDRINEFNEEFSNLLNTTVEINADKLPIDKIDDFDLTPQQMLNLEMFFEE